MPEIVRNARGSNNDLVVRKIKVGASQTLKEGDLVQIDPTSRLLVAAAAASTTLVGVALEDITTGASVTNDDAILVALIRGQVVRVPVYQGGAKDTFAQADFYATAYDLFDKTSVNPNDTTGGMCFVQANDQANNTADVIFADASLANVG